MMMVRTVWKLLRARWWIFLNGLRRARGRRRFGYIAFIIVMLVVAGGAFALNWMVLSLLQKPEVIEVVGGAALESIPTLMLSAAFLAVLLISFQVLLEALYLAGDMDFLLSSPVPARAVFVAKLFQAVLPNFLLLALFTLPVLWGLGAASGYNVLYYPLALLLLALQVLAATGLSALLVMAVVRIFPARRVFEVLSFLGAVLAMLCSQWYNLGRRLSVSEGEFAPAFAQTTRALSRFSNPWLPLTWPGLGLVALAQGKWLAGLGYLTLSAGLAVGVFTLSLRVAERLYYSGWARVQAAPARKPKRVVARPGVHARRLLLPPVVISIVQKDLRVWRRDLRNLSQLIGPVILAIIYVVLVLSRGSTDDHFVKLTQRYVFYLNIFIVLFVGSGLVIRLATMGFSQEGKHYWILKTAPVSASQLVLAKWLVAYLPTLAVGSLFLVGIGVVQRAPLGDIIFGWLVVAFVAAGNTGLNLAFGITAARIDWTDPRHMISGGTGCLAALLGFGFQGLNVALFIGPIFLVRMVGGPIILGQLIGLVLGSLLSLLMAFLPPRLVLKRVPRIGEETAD
jgi:ABC-2 type transport system permease protein